MYTLRTRIGKDIVAEFLPPASYWKRKKGKIYKDKVIILADGMPSVPSKRGLIEYLSKKGYWVFHPRYRGSWESGGVFLKDSPHKDIALVIDTVSFGKIKNLWDQSLLRVRPSQIILMGSSFGGPAVLLNAADARIRKVIAFSPVIDWKVNSKVEPIHKLARFMKEAFVMGYRTHPTAWKRIQSGTFYNPIAEAKKLPGEKILIVHAKDDDIVHFRPAVKFTTVSRATMYLDARGGHMGLSTLMKPKYWKRVEKFLKS